MAKWIIGKDGDWENPDADPNCKTCDGHGVCDNGDQYAYYPVNCPTCCPEKLKPKKSKKAAFSNK